jgi:hypothetical protein
MGGTPNDYASHFRKEDVTGGYIFHLAERGPDGSLMLYVPNDLPSCEASRTDLPSGEYRAEI